MTNRSCQLISQPCQMVLMTKAHKVGEQTCSYFKNRLESGSFMQKFHEWSSRELVRMFSVTKRRAGNAKMSK